MKEFEPLGFEYNPIKDKAIAKHVARRPDTAISSLIIEFKQRATLTTDLYKKTIAQNPRVPMTIQKLSEKAPELANYYIENKKLILEQKCEYFMGRNETVLFQDHFL